MTVFVLKLIAMITMAIDHIGFQLMDNNLLMRLIGRTAFMVYAFLIAEGYYHMKNEPARLGKHAGKLLLLCLVTEVPFDLFEFGRWIDFQTQSVLPTLLLGFLALAVSGWWMDRINGNGLAGPALGVKAGSMDMADNEKAGGGSAFANAGAAGPMGCAVICLAAACGAQLIHSEYRFAGVLLVVLFYLYLKKAADRNLAGRVIGLACVYAVYLLLYIWQRAGFGGWQAFAESFYLFRIWIIGICISIIPLALYNRNLGYHSKWFDAVYSCFYPVQFAVIIIMRGILQGV